MLYAFLVAGAAVCALMAVRAQKLISSALWLAGVSALAAIILYRLGAHQVAVVELSVGAGLVTVLFVFAISIAGDDTMQAAPRIPVRLAVGLLLIFAALLGWMILPLDGIEAVSASGDLSAVLWEDRALDVLVQVVLIFTGVLGVLGLLSEAAVPAMRRVPAATTVQPNTAKNGHTPQPALALDLSGAEIKPEAADVHA
ncbi:NADH-quinone oxidoreductase subunit J [Aggregatilinea lenta]|uniref:NADH-quinone oxidoreductase subunit J n=1 Tax=Aggregatilinea lenta TaxID=913108 RepID=UPI0013C2CB14|nr:NADH-quinone oxidoreductase subunit J [Aggregatilinea lenta]